MKIKELIEKLKEFDPEIEVNVEACGCCAPPLGKVTLTDSGCDIILSA